MYRDEFEALLDGWLQHIKNILSTKSEEYSSDDDVLRNFNDTAELNGVEPEYALWGFVSKHIIALKDFIKMAEEEGVFVTRSQWYEKINDIICYLLLLKALLKERENNETNKV